LKNKIISNLCSDLPDALWQMKRHMVSLPYEKELLAKKLIRPSKSPWSCAAFYFNKNSDIERDTPRLIINYKPLNTTLQIRRPIPNKKDLLKRLTDAKIF
ncbi:LOW QUALITY PROTEIN: hypothetical protein CFOL_v3_31224, partial [Cephalotus follicularis]